MSGKIVGIVLILAAAIAGGAMYYLQVFGFYKQVQASGSNDVKLTLLMDGQPEAILYDGFQAIDAESSPIRFRACFTTTMSHALLKETYVMLENVSPRNAPGWFSCFDAEAIATELEAGTALLFLGEKNQRYGVDRVVAITEDGRGYIWHELNDCGEKAYDGSVIGEECPERPASAPTN